MNHIKGSGTSLLKNKLYASAKSQNGLTNFINNCSYRGVSDVGLAQFSTTPLKRTAASSNFSKRAFHEAAGGSFLLQEPRSRSAIAFVSPYQLAKINGLNPEAYCFTRSFASRASEATKQKQSETRKAVSNVEDPFDSPTYNIPEKPLTFTEGFSYASIILIGLGLAGAAAYAVFTELIFQPKEYKIFGKALKRIQNDGQVKVRIGSPITGYGSESRNRAARQRIPNKIWTDENGVERVEVNFYIRGPHGAGKVSSEMFKDSEDNQWKFTYLIVEVSSPTRTRLMLESYVPA